jgi:ABC-type transport system involved in cytochrome c biogenesis permease component
MFYIVLLWVTVLLVHRSHGIEESVGTRASVATLPIDPASVFFGKALALMIQLWVTAFVLLSGAVVLLHVALHGAVVASGSVAVCIVALAFAGTLYGALSSGPSGQSSLLALLSLPAFAPLLIAGERSFSAGLYGGNLKEWWLLLLTGVVAYSAAGYFLYGVIEDY